MALREDELCGLSGEVDLGRDRALVERCQKGDQAAFGTLYSCYYDRLLRFCDRRLHDRDEAEDAAQEAFARAWRALPRFAGERRFYPWLTVIAGNICTDILRRRSRTTPTADVDQSNRLHNELESTESSEDLVLASVDGELVAMALGRLSSRHRKVLGIREGSGWTYQQIATHEGVEVGTIETLLWRARQALKREFAVLEDSRAAMIGFAVAGASLFRRLGTAVNNRLDMARATTMGMGLREAVAAAAFATAAVTAVAATPAHTAHPSAQATSPVAQVSSAPPTTLVASAAASAARDRLGRAAPAGTSPSATSPGTTTSSGTGPASPESSSSNLPISSVPTTHPGSGVSSPTVPTQVPGLPDPPLPAVPGGTSSVSSTVSSVTAPVTAAAQTVTQTLTGVINALGSLPATIPGPTSPPDGAPGISGSSGGVLGALGGL